MTESVSVPSLPFTSVSVIIPARNSEQLIGDVIHAVWGQDLNGIQVEILVIDDGSTDATAELARAAGAIVVSRRAGDGGNPAAARNLGARRSTGDPLVFLDADCIPAPGWLATLLQAHADGATIVGGALELPPGLPLSARCDYYCGWYHVHSRRRAGYVPNHPPGNVSVRRAAFLSSAGFEERHPIAFAHEELAWQAELGARGHSIRFEPSAVVYHRNRPGFANLLRRNYRWAYSAVESKAATGAARLAWMYRYPRALAVLGPVLAIAQTGYIIACWVRAGRWEPLAMVPAVLSARIAYTAGMISGTLRWLSNDDHRKEARPRWE